MTARGTRKPGAARTPAATLFLFGGRGDLVRRLLVPALFSLHRQGLLHPEVRIVGIDHNPSDDEQFRTRLREFLQELAGEPDAEGGGEAFDARAWESFAPRLSYLQGDFEDEQTYGDVTARLRAAPAANAVFYLATAPRFFGEIARRLAHAGLLAETTRAFRRLVVEKPFGTDLPSAHALNCTLLGLMEESQIYRIDHFLGKQAVQNIFATRFATGAFEAFWNRHYVDHVQITAAETVGVEGRGGFYEHSGALRDMVPNHLFQLLAMAAMEPPAGFDADGIRTEKARLLSGIRCDAARTARVCAVRGQYAAGSLGGVRRRGYRTEPKVARDSNVETFVAMKLMIENTRWWGVPFYLRTGKRMSARTTEVALCFKRAPATAFDHTPFEQVGTQYLTLRINPDEGIAFDVAARPPGYRMAAAPARLALDLEQTFERPKETGYEALLYACLTGDQTLFERADAIEASWRAVQPFLDAWAEDDTVLPYPAGTDGPPAAHELLARDGRQWRPLR